MVISKFKNLAFLILGFFIFSSLAVLAQEMPVGVPAGPSAEEIKKFEEEFGAPPEAFKEPEVEKPKFEEPGKVPEEVKQYVSDKELAEVYCAMTKWKSGAFFLALDALKSNLLPAIEKVKELGIDVEIPDIDSLKTEGQRKIEAICAAPTLAEAENLVKEFSDWGQVEAASKFDNLRSMLQEKMKAKGDEFRERINTEINQFVATEKTAMESELLQEAEQLATEKQAELAGSKVSPDIEAIKAELQAQIEAKVAIKKSELEQKIQAKIDEIMGGQKEKFDEIDKLFQGMDKKINDVIKTGQSQYEQYKLQAFELRKALVFKILDKNIEEGLKQLEAASADIEEAKKEDPSIKSVGEIKAELQEDRRTLEAELDTALETGDEVTFQNALNNFRVKWENFRKESEKAAAQSVNKACTVALAQFDKGKEQIQSNLPKINSVVSKCADSSSEECLKVNELAPRFNSLTTKINDLQSEMSMVENICKSPETADRKNLVALLKKTQSDAEDLKTYGEALEAEKSKAIAASTQEICGQVLPQLYAAKSQLVKNDMVVLKNRIENCKNKTTQECNIVNQLTDKFNKLNTKVNDFLGNITKVENLCQNPSEQNLEDMRDVLNSMKEKGEELRLLGAELRAEQAQKASTKILCRAILSELDMAKKDMSLGLGETSALQSGCKGETANAKCVGVNSLSDKFILARTQSETILKKISNINATCNNAGDEPPSDSFISDIDSLKTDKDALMKTIADLKTEKEKHYEMGEEIGIPLNSTWEGTLPATKTLELFGRIDYQKAAGGQFLMEISVNGQPLPGTLLNKGKTFRFADGRSFPYYSQGGGGSANTSFSDGRPFTYYNPPSPAWLLFYVPNYSTDNTSAGGGYQVMTDVGQAHRYVWDISSLIGNSQTMDVRISNNGFVGPNTLPLEVKLYAK